MPEHGLGLAMRSLGIQAGGGPVNPDPNGMGTFLRDGIVRELCLAELLYTGTRRKGSTLEVGSRTWLLHLIKHLPLTHEPTLAALAPTVLSLEAAQV